MPLGRRDLLRTGVVGAATLAFGPAFWRAAYAEPATPGPGPYGPLGPPNADGVRLPEGFRARVVARSGEEVAGTGYRWHPNPDGGACYDAEDGGWFYASNSESGPPDGGASALRFDADGTVVDASRILGGTVANCAGGPTPWGTWLSCEEFDGGHVWECDPSGRREAAERSALGTFAHEAVAVDPDRRALYLTEDRPDGRFYRFTPDGWPSLDAGTLDVATVAGGGPGGSVTWQAVGADQRAALQEGAADTTPFAGGEGCWYDRGRVYFTTKGDNRVWSLSTEDDELEVIYDFEQTPDAPLSGVDNVTVSPAGDLYVAEDGGDMQVCVVSRRRELAPFLQVVGHEGSEVTGPAFTTDGRRLYFSSQRGPGGGVTYEVEGPFTRPRPGPRFGRKAPG